MAAPTTCLHKILGGTSGKFQQRFAEFVIDDLHVEPVYSVPKPGAKSLEKCFLGGKPKGEVLCRKPAGLTIIALTQRKQSLQKGGIILPHKTLETADFSDINTSTYDQ